MAFSFYSLKYTITELKFSFKGKSSKDWRAEAKFGALREKPGFVAPEAPLRRGSLRSALKLRTKTGKSALERVPGDRLPAVQAIRPLAFQRSVAARAGSRRRLRDPAIYFPVAAVNLSNAIRQLLVRVPVLLFQNAPEGFGDHQQALDVAAKEINIGPNAPRLGGRCSRRGFGAEIGAGGRRQIRSVEHLSTLLILTI